MTSGPKTLGDTVFRVAALVSGIIILGIALLTVFNAVLRALSFRGVPATYELSEQLLAAAIFFGLALATIGDLHVKVELLSARLGEIGRRALMVLGGVGLMVLSASMFRYLVEQAQDALDIGETTLAAGVPVAPFMIIAACGAFLATLAGAVYVWRAAVTGRATDIGTAPTGDPE